MQDIQERDISKYDVTSQIFKALGHPARLMIVDRLARGEHSVGQLTELVGSDMSTVSKHLSVLKSVGVVGCRRWGTQNLYRLEMLCVGGFIRCVEESLHGQARGLLQRLGPLGAVSGDADGK